MHGLGESGLCFEGIVAREELSDARQILLDLPGYGRSDHHGQPKDLSATADALATLLVVQGYRDAVLIGHSMGGVIGTVALGRHPELCAGFVNVEGNLSPGDCTLSADVAARDEEEFLAAGAHDVIDGVFLTGRDSAAHRGYYVSLRLCDPATLYRHSQELVRASAREDLARRMADLQVPTLYVGGAPGGVCERSLHLLQDAGVEIELVQPAGHWPFIDQPAGFAAALRRFLERLPF